MKKILIIGLILSATNSFAGWEESVKCSVERISVDDGSVARSSSDSELKIEGSDNGETGEVTIVNSLIPSYPLSFNRASGGRTEEAELTTRVNNRVIAMSSVDLQQSEFVSNRFVTLNGDYQITVTCSCSIK